jgi:myo-inositol-1-phosphate synthase
LENILKQKTTEKSTLSGRKIRVAIAGLGNCAGGLIEGVAFYRKNRTTDGLIFPVIGGYRVENIEVVCAFDVSKAKVGRPIREAIYATPNNFNRISDIDDLGVTGQVYRGNTLDGNPTHLQEFVDESDSTPVKVVEILKKHKVDVLVNLLPTGSHEATRYYGEAALEAGSAFINCIPTPYAQEESVSARYESSGIPLIGDDIKSQIGSTIIHRTILDMLQMRGAKVTHSTQINTGGNTDFANFVHRAESKIISKQKSLSLYTDSEMITHVGNHYNPARGSFKKAYFDLEGLIFAGSKMQLSVQLDIDDKPNLAGCLVDLVRIAKTAKDQGKGGVIEEACAFYMKSAPTQMKDKAAHDLVEKTWTITS